MSLRERNLRPLREDPAAEDRPEANRALAMGRRAARAQEPLGSRAPGPLTRRVRAIPGILAQTAPKRRAGLASVPRSGAGWW